MSKKKIQILLKINDKSLIITEKIESYLFFSNYILSLFNNAVETIKANSTTVIELFSIMLKVKIVFEVEKLNNFLVLKQINNLKIYRKRIRKIV